MQDRLLQNFRYMNTITEVSKKHNKTCNPKSDTSVQEQSDTLNGPEGRSDSENLGGTPTVGSTDPEVHE